MSAGVPVGRLWLSLESLGRYAESNMDAHCKKIQAAAKVDGDESLRYIKCDLDESTGHPRAMLFWPSALDGRHAFQKLDPQHLCPTSDEGLAYIYTGSPIRIEKVLAEMRPEPLSDDGFRLGFFFLPENPTG